MRDDRLQRPLRTTITYAIAGIVASAVIHAYFESNWAYYVRSISAERLAQRGGGEPPPFIANSPRSAGHGAIAFLLGGLAAGAVARRCVIASAAFAIGVAAAHALLTLMQPEGQSNLWPLSIIAVWLVSLAPAAAGATLPCAVRVWHGRSRGGAA